MINNKVRIIGITLSVLVLAGLVGVMFLTVQRAQQLTSTITRPKAECFAHDGAGNCTKYDNEGPAGCSASPPACCDHLGSEYGGCSWDGASTGGSRGWCSWTQCGGAPLARSAANGGNQNCGLFRQTYCMSGTSCSRTSSCANGLTCRNGACVNDEVANPCWTYQPIPKSWSAGNLSWEWDTTYATANWAIVYVWTNSGRSGDAYAAASANASSGYKSVNISGFSPALQPDTTYYVKVNPNSYNSPDAAHQCMDSATRGWMFATQSGPAPTVCNSNPLPKNGVATVNGTAASFSWAWDTTYSNTLTSAAVDVFNCAARTSNCLVWQAGGNGLAFTSHAGIAAGSNLAPGTQYWWTVVPVSPTNVDPTTSCWPAWTFTTGGVTCPSGETSCGGVCKNLQTDTTNCGVCGKACTSTQTCTNAACVTPTECTTDDSCATDKKCTNNACVAISCTTADVCKTATVANHVCTITDRADGTACETGGKTCANGVCTSTEVNACWGNGGTGTNAGRCYDCNGDGTVNILDFSCFRLNWLKPVQ